MKTHLAPEHVSQLITSMFGKLVSIRRDVGNRPLKVYGIPRGGVPVALALATLANAVTDEGVYVCSHAEGADIFVDDIYDSGATEKRYAERFPNTPFLCLIDKRDEQWKDQWIVLPWEVRESGEDASAYDIVTRLFEYIGEDPNREGLKETPARFLRAWAEWGEGYKLNPKDILKTFTDGAEDCDEMVIVANIPVVSKCEHHLADIIGMAHVGYIPNGRIVGLSKLARVTDLYARRLQVQERLTNQIATSIWEVLEPKGVGVIIKAAHNCMATRGVRIHDALTITSSMKGALRENGPARAEFMALCASAEK